MVAMGVGVLVGRWCHDLKEGGCQVGVLASSRHTFGTRSVVTGCAGLLVSARSTCHKSKHTFAR